MGISGMGEEATPLGVVVMAVVEDAEFEVNPIPHVVEVGSISTEDVDDDVFEVVHYANNEKYTPCIILLDRP
jgi:hypothetical protein